MSSCVYVRLVLWRERERELFSREFSLLLFSSSFDAVRLHLLDSINSLPVVTRRLFC